VRVSFRLLDLVELHSLLLWEEIVTATAAVLREGGREPPHPFTLEVIGVPGFGSETIEFLFDVTGIAFDRITKIQRTYEPSRLVELAAIAIAAVRLAHAGEHEILDVAYRGSAADYLVDHAGHCLEIAGRSRKGDLESAWQQKWQRLREQGKGGCYVSVSEFETHSGRLEFRLLDPGTNHVDGTISGQ
jgi:hypothetical protein